MWFFSSDRLVLQGQTIPLINEYKYLGVVVRKDGISQNDLVELGKKRLIIILEMQDTLGSHNTGIHYTMLVFTIKHS